MPVEYALVEEFAIFVNGAPTTNFTFSDNTINEYGTTLITFNDSYTPSDFIALTAIGPTTINGVTTNYSWSTPQTEYFLGDGVLNLFNLTTPLTYNNAVNAVVNVNGRRVQTPGGVGYVADGATTIYAVPDRLASPAPAEDTAQSSLTLANISVYINDSLIDQSLYTLQPWTGSGSIRTIRFTNPPALADRIYIVATYNVQATFNITNNTLEFLNGYVPPLNSVISVTTWNDTREQRMETLVFVGPAYENYGIVSEGFDETPFDSATVNNTPGSFSYSTGTAVVENDLYLNRVITDPSRLWVTLNGRRLSANIDYTISNNYDADDYDVGSEIVLPNLLQDSDVVMVTLVTDSVVPEAMEFRIFQDMRGVQSTYRMTPATTTTVTQAVTASADIIHVADASALSVPELAANVWGVVTINGERIMYRHRDLSTNTISSLLRGTAGTGAANHAVGSAVYDLGQGNLLNSQYQNYIVADTTLANGTTTTFIAKDITETFGDSALLEAAIEVYVGGTLVTTGYTFTSYTPVTIEFTTAPADGSDVTILIKRGVTWYQQGAGTASNGVPLQETDTVAARFLRGL